MEIRDWILIALTIVEAALIYVVIAAKAYANKKGENLATLEDIKKISFESEIGKNLATKLDIEEITKKVEAIKTDLHFDTQFKISLASEKKQSILQVYDAYYIWFNKVVSIQSSNIDMDERAIDKVISEMSEAYFKFFSAKAKVDLYIKDRELVEILVNILSVSVVLHLKVQERLADVLIYVRERKAHGFEEMRANPINFIKEFEDKNIDIESHLKVFTSRMLASKEKMEKSQAEYHKIISEKISEIAKLSITFKDICHKLISNKFID